MSVDDGRLRLYKLFFQGAGQIKVKLPIADERLYFKTQFIGLKKEIIGTGRNSVLLYGPDFSIQSESFKGPDSAENNLLGTSYGSRKK